MARVVLFFPSYFSDEAAPPLALLHLAGPLLARGHDVRIVDSAISKDPVAELLAAAEGAACVGVSMVTGPMITLGVEVARAVRARHPGVPVVAGGWHPSILPEQTLKSDCFDAVVKGQGEVTFTEIVERYAAGERDLSGIGGSLFKKNGEIVWNPDRGYTDIGSMPRRPFHLVDFEAYARKCGGYRWILFCTSHGCPWDCSYCSNASVYGRNWKPLTPEASVEEMGDLVRRYGLQSVDIIDDNYLVRKDRSLEIAEKILEAGLRFEYFFQTRTDQIDRLTDAELRLLARSGLRRVFFGLESGSAKVMRSVNKRLDLETAYRTAARFKEVGIQPSFNLIFGLPAEEEEDLRQTVQIVGRLIGANRESAFFTNIFSPYPGSPIWPLAVRQGVREPQSLEEWAEFYPKIQVLPWLEGKKHARIQVIRDYIRMAHGSDHMIVRRAVGWKRRLHALLRHLALWRLRSLAVKFPFEVWAIRAWREWRRAPAVIN